MLTNWISECCCCHFKRRLRTTMTNKQPGLLLLVSYDARSSQSGVPKLLDSLRHLRRSATALRTLASARCDRCANLGAPAATSQPLLKKSSNTPPTRRRGATRRHTTRSERQPPRAAAALKDGVVGATPLSSASQEDRRPRGTRAPQLASLAADGDSGAGRSGS